MRIENEMLSRFNTEAQSNNLEKSIDINHNSMKDIAESTESTAEAIQRQATMCAEIQENTDIAEK